MSKGKLDFEPLIENGTYPVVYYGYTCRETFGDARLLVYFQIPDVRFKNMVFTKWFNIINYHKTSKNNYKFKASKRSDFPKFWKTIFPNQKIRRFDRFSPSNLKGMMFNAEIAESKVDYRQKSIDKDLRVSKIRKIKPC